MDLMFCMYVMGVDLKVCVCVCVCVREEILLCNKRTVVANLML
jgi:hypothetical protein